jgi:hypothetical protein
VRTDHGVRIISPLRVGDEADDLPCLGDLLQGVGDAARIEGHQRARDLARAAARVGVVTDIGDAVRAQMRCADGENPLLDGRRDPRVQAVRDEIVERPEAPGNVLNVLVMEDDIAQPEGGRHRRPLRNCLRCQINADESTARQCERHRDKIRAVAAAQLQHMAPVE